MPRSLVQVRPDPPTVSAKTRDEVAKRFYRVEHRRGRSIDFGKRILELKGVWNFMAKDEHGNFVATWTIGEEHHETDLIIRENHFHPDEL